MQVTKRTNSAFDVSVIRHSLFYLLAAIPGSLSMLYKERVIRDQPVDMSYLNAWVSVNQFIGGLLAAPLIFDAEVSCASAWAGWLPF
jgi:hypothetical protein